MKERPGGCSFTAMEQDTSTQLGFGNDAVAALARALHTARCPPTHLLAEPPRLSLNVYCG